ncbi:replication protein RepA [Leifsonia sp. Leaf264]|uniref:replication protein RepA n=1 Tax=Leifsonia sp. Leaf264 TaxID=1736314 RepID=UPI0006FE445C|nr:replication protein RepA [Leifsonia sp. Leaf264]KQO98716.1 hypothetical protein ASF30_11680 [Leifsonia sp. Leaf264]
MFDESATDAVSDATAELEPKPLSIPRNRVGALNYAGAMEHAERAGSDIQDRGFSAKIWAQVSIPYLEPPAGTQLWERRNGDVVLRMQPALIDDPTTGELNVPKFPYGIIPRHALTWMATEAVLTRSRELEIGSSVNEFMRKLGMTPSGPNAKKIPDQLNRIWGSHVTVSEVSRGGGRTPNHTGGDRMPILDNIRLWTNDDGDIDDSGHWRSSVKLSEAFYDSIIKAPVAVDLNILKLLKNSPMQIDIYIWATHKAYGLEKPMMIKWETLAMQFGSNFSRIRAFREKFIKHLDLISVMYTGLNYEATSTHLIMKPSKTSIKPKRPPRQIA